jgi:succinoglycan biosynthesis protein ExoA
MTQSSDTATEPGVSVILVCRNERAYIRRCIENLQQQTGVPSFYEIIIADGCSDDGTAEIVRNLAHNDERIRVVENSGRIVPTGLNAGICIARGAIIVRADAHAEYSLDYVSACVQALRMSGADNVGGPPRTLATTYFQAANAAAFHSPFSAGGARFHDPSFEGFVDTVQFGCWWRDRLLALGLFDESLVRNQDDELNFRIHQSGGRIWQTPSIVSWYYPRRTPGSLFRQYFQYGYWKVRVMRKHRMPTTLRQLVPVSALAAALVLAALAPISSVARLALAACAGAYVMLSLLASLLAARAARRWDIAPVLPVVFGIYHLSYALGFCVGLYDALTFGDRIREAASRLTR